MSAQWDSPWSHAALACDLQKNEYPSILPYKFTLFFAKAFSASEVTAVIGHWCQQKHPSSVRRQKRWKPCSFQRKLFVISIKEGKNRSAANPIIGTKHPTASFDNLNNYFRGERLVVKNCTSEKSDCIPRALHLYVLDVPKEAKSLTRRKTCARLIYSVPT